MTDQAASQEITEADWELVREAIELFVMALVLAWNDPAFSISPEASPFRHAGWMLTTTASDGSAAKPLPQTGFLVRGLAGTKVAIDSREETISVRDAVRAAAGGYLSGHEDFAKRALKAQTTLRYRSMLTAYFDESGTQAASPVLSVGGYIGRDENWQVFEAEWKKALDDFGIDFFHMTDFENRRRQFSSWPTNRRITRLNRLITIANRHTVATAGMSVDRQAYERILPEPLKRSVRGPYGLALKGCLASLKRLSKAMRSTEPITIIFDFGADKAGTIEQETLRAIRENAEESRYFTVLFERKRHLPALQAADIVAYDMCKEVARLLGHHGRQKRALMVRLEERFKYWGYMDAEELEQFVQRNRHRVSTG